MPRRLRATVPMPPSDTAHFVTHLLPSLLQAHLQRQGAKDAWVLQVLVPGHPECRVHYLLEGSDLRIRPGFAASPALTLSVQLPELEQLCLGALDVQEALILNRIRLFGDRRKLDLLAGGLGNPALGAPT